MVSICHSHAIRAVGLHQGGGEPRSTLLKRGDKGPGFRVRFWHSILPALDTPCSLCVLQAWGTHTMQSADRSLGHIKTLESGKNTLLATTTVLKSRDYLFSLCVICSIIGSPR